MGINMYPSPSEILHGVPKLQVPNFDGLLQEIGTDPEGIASVVDNKLAETIAAAKEHNVRPEAVFERLNPLYRIWEVLQNKPPTEPKVDILTYSSVSNHFPGHQIIAFNALLEHFSKHIFRPLGMLTLDRNPLSTNTMTQKYGAYNLEGLWLPFAHNTRPAQINFTKKEVILKSQEILEDENEARIDLFHNTSSVALGGIARQHAILSTNAAKSKGVQVVSGEYLHAGEHEQRDGRFDYVYTSNLLDTGYSTMRWFDEYPAVFGFCSNDIEAYASERLPRKASFRGIEANGHEIPDEIPLTLSKGLYTPLQNIPSLELWANANLPGAKVYCLEAAILARENLIDGLGRYPHYPYRFGKPMEDADSLLQKMTITV